MILKFLCFSQRIASIEFLHSGLAHKCSDNSIAGNIVEIWFNRITQQAIRRGTFRSVKELVEKIDQYVQT